MITKTSPEDIGRYQIGYILVKQKFANQVKDCRSFDPYIDSDHTLVIRECDLKLKTLHNTFKQELYLGKS